MRSPCSCGSPSRGPISARPRSPVPWCGRRAALASALILATGLEYGISIGIAVIGDNAVLRLISPE
jgi:hypothetical protein